MELTSTTSKEAPRRNPWLLRPVALAIVLGQLLSGCGEMDPAVDVLSQESAGLRASPERRHRHCPRPGAPAGEVTFVSEVQRGSNPARLSRHADGTLWFTDYERTGLARVAMDGSLAWYYPVGFPQGEMTESVVGGDGNVWFNGSTGESLEHVIGRMTLDGRATLFPLPNEQRALRLTKGADGNVWFSTGDHIGKITPEGAIEEFEAAASDIAAGPAGSTWFTQTAANRVGRLSKKGVVTLFELPTVGAAPGAITLGPDGNLWFLETGVSRIARITPKGHVTEFEVPGSLGLGAAQLAAGPDGALWFPQVSNEGPVAERVHRIGRITTSGSVSEVALPSVLGSEGLYVPVHAVGLAFGGDGNLWATAWLDGFYESVVLRITPASCAKK